MIEHLSKEQENLKKEAEKVKEVKLKTKKVISSAIKTGIHLIKEEG